jgi:hypothetical protein
MEAFRQARNSELEALDSLFFNEEETLHRLAATYAQKHDLYEGF